MAYDVARHQVVIYGGRNANLFGGLWTWDGNNWSEHVTAPMPPPRQGPVFVYDALHANAVLVSGGFSDTWLWNGSAWNEKIPSNAPPQRYDPGMAYDVLHDRIVMFGGSYQGAVPDSGGYVVGNAILFDTWLWNGSRWSQANPSTVPTAQFPLMSYDTTRSQVILFDGGYMWLWDGSNWTRQTSHMNVSRQWSALAYDSARGGAVIFGGNGYGILNDTWVWDGTYWSQLAPASSPPKRQFHAMTYDAAHAQIVMFGGNDNAGTSYSDTWLWDGNTWTQELPPPIKARWYTTPLTGKFCSMRA